MYEESPAYVPSPDELGNDSPVYNPNSPEGPPPGSPQYHISSPDGPPPDGPQFFPSSPDEAPTDGSQFSPSSPDEPPPVAGLTVKNADMKRQFDSLPEREKLTLMKIVAEKISKEGKEDDEETEAEPVNFIMKKQNTGESNATDATSILRIAEEKTEEEKQKEKENETTELEGGNSSSSSGQTKTIAFTTDAGSDSTSSSNNGIKEIKL